MKVLVTGASGRFAAYMVRALRGKCDIALFSRSEPPADRADLPCIRGDLNDFEACQRAVRGIDVVQHLGAVPWPSDHPGPRAARRARGLPKVPFDATIRTNIVGTYYLLTAAVQAGVRAVIMTGSNCAFGHCFHLTERPYPIVYLPLDEAHPTDHEDSYSYSKFAGEVLLKTFTNAYGIRTYVTRPAGICPPERLQGMAEDAAPAAGWSGVSVAVPHAEISQAQAPPVGCVR